MIAFSKRLNETGFRILNKCGLAQTLYKNMDTYGYLKEKFADEIEKNSTSIKKAIIDNLNFTMKMAKAIKSGAGSMKRQLNLCTSQVSYRTNANILYDTMVDQDSSSARFETEANDQEKLCGSIHPGSPESK